MERLTEENVRFHFLGDISYFPLDLQDNFRKAEHGSKEKSGVIVNLALAYEGRNEIARALKKLVCTGVRGEEITEQLIKNYLDTAGQPDPDLVIRTGGRSRLSSYLPWQTVYSEIYLSNVLWPDFTVEEFDKTISWYKEQVRTFGR